MAKRNSSGKTWREHSRGYLKKALEQASRTWKPKKKRESQSRKLSALRKRRDDLNGQIRKLREE